MTEIDVHKQSNAAQQFVLYWGDMGGQWGVNRSVAQIHALLYLSPRPMNAEDISQSLGIARSNVSNSLKELVTWKLIRRIPIQGDRREHFEAELDVWEMAMRIAQGRKERELDPAAAALDQCIQQAQGETGLNPIVLQRLNAMQDFMNTTTHWYDQMLNVPKSQLNMLMKMGDKVLAVLKFAGRKGT